MTIGITGATGNIGGTAARTLAAGGHDLRLIVRDPARAPELPGASVAQATYDDREAMLAAFDGLDALLLVSAAESPNRREQHRRAIRAAADAGVGQILYTSFDGASPDAIFTLGRDHFDAETAIAESGVPATLLRDNFYLEVFRSFAGPDRVIRGPAGDGALAAVARADVAAVVAAVLRDPSPHAGHAYRLTGGEALTMADAARRLTAATGDEYRFHDETIDEAYASRRAFSDEQFLLDAWVSTYLAIASGHLAGVSGDVERLVGRPPLRLEDVLQPAE